MFYFNFIVNRKRNCTQTQKYLNLVSNIVELFSGSILEKHVEINVEDLKKQVQKLYSELFPNTKRAETIYIERKRIKFL